MEFITANSLIKKGIPSGLFWNTADKNKPIEKDRIIVYTLKKGFNERILTLYVDIFGITTIKKAIDKHKKDLSHKFYLNISNTLKTLS